MIKSNRRHSVQGLPAAAALALGLLAAAAMPGHADQIVTFDASRRWHGRGAGYGRYCHRPNGSNYWSQLRRERRGSWLLALPSRHGRLVQCPRGGN
jgi:hypothetical protein